MRLPAQLAVFDITGICFITHVCIPSMCHKRRLSSLFHNSSGGRTGRDFERVQGGSGGLSVQRQSQHQGWGAGLWDSHQMDQTRAQLQSAGTKKEECVCEVCVRFCCDTAVYVTKMSTHVFVSWNRAARYKTLVTTDNTDTVCLQSHISGGALSTIPVCSEGYTE